MQAVLSRVHRIVVPEEPEAAAPLVGISVSSPSIPLSPTSPKNAPVAVQAAVSSQVKAEIELAVERLQFATLLGERKKAVNALQLLAQKFDASRSPGGRRNSSVEPTVEEQELGDAAVPAVLAALVSDPRDTELMEAMLEFLQAITCLTLLQDPSPWIRGPAIALVRALQDAQPSAFAKSVLECKEGLRRLLEVVEDRREHIRDAALAVLGQLTGRDKNAQQFLAFEEGFARLFQIMEVEGLTETGVSPASSVIADCLQIVNNMVRDNLMTQTLFLEMPYLETHVPRILRLPGVDAYDISDAGARDESSSEEDEAHYLFLLYERAFTIFYREMAEQIQKRVIAIYTGVDGGSSNASGVDSGAPNAMGAYQDLIRMQDKQIHDLQRQIEQLKQREVNQGGERKEFPTPDRRQEQQFSEQLSAQREKFEREKQNLESQIKSMSESAQEMETRVNGLTVAYEQLEQEHQQRGQELSNSRSRYEGMQSFTPANIVNEQLAALQAELDVERETNRRLQTEAAAAKGVAASQTLREKNDAELASARLLKQLEELRVESERKDEQLSECNQMLETLTEGQALVKSDNEKLKAQLSEALSRYSEGGKAEFKSVVDGLMESKAHLERRVQELEAAARVAYEKDQEVLRQRIQEVEQARQASPPLNEEPNAAVTNDNDGRQEVNTDDHRLKELVSTQLEELKELRALVIEMESVAKEREAKVQQAAFLQELVAGYNVKSRRDKEKFDATIRELEDELARAFLEKKDAGRKAKAAVKELENEVARLFLAKVELEKELVSHQHGNSFNHIGNGSVNGALRRSVESDNSSESTVDDLLVLVASLEIQCSVLRESLKDAQGEDAVAVAVELSRQRGAVVSV
ncbi:Vesicle tethering protein [Phytophthora megakarya]|uniref:Vesicle tethering protein n=1 Tax=Phytophthora megakarya TaxID=4795 RepID=A0A225X635_9STRA|nr:Vesicle tethering protein [Phytophthora megakarya]